MEERTYGRSYGRRDSDVISKTKISRIDGLPYFLTHGARASSATRKILEGGTKYPQSLLRITEIRNNIKSGISPLARKQVGIIIII